MPLVHILFLTLVILWYMRVPGLSINLLKYFTTVFLFIPKCRPLALLVFKRIDSNTYTGRHSTVSSLKNMFYSDKILNM